MPDELGRFQKGEHWRPHQSFRDKDWLVEQYVVLQRSSSDIGKEFGVGDSAILFWLHRHNIPRRSISESRKIKYWGNSGSANGMYGKRGAEVPSWRGGVTPERQVVYSSPEWAFAVIAVRERDRGYCLRCGRCRRKTVIHHIVSFQVKELRTALYNLITLCADCHRWVHSKKNVNWEFIGEGVMLNGNG